MSHFYGSMCGNRGEATRCGTKDSGHYGHIRGWNSGVQVDARYSEWQERDEFHISGTGGSSGYGSYTIGKVYLDDEDNLVFEDYSGNVRILRTGS